MKITSTTDRLRAAAMLAAAGLAHAAMAGGDLNVNLIANGSFESVDLNEPGPFSSFRILDWQDFSTAFPVDPMNPEAADDTFAYPYFPTAYAYVSRLLEPGAGDFHYTGGFSTGANEIQIFQQVTIPVGSAAADLIAGGTAQYELSAYFSTFFGQDEASFALVSFVDANGSQIGASREIGGEQFVSALGFDDDNGTASGGDPFFAGTRLWGRDRTVGTVPAGTAAVFVAIGSTSGAGNFDGYVDLIDFRVGTEFEPVLPGTFTITSPDAGTFGIDTGPVLTWAPSVLATDYTVIIADNAALTDPIVELNTADLTADLPDGTLGNGVFYAQIFANNIDGSSPAANGPLAFAVVTGAGGPAGCNPADISPLGAPDGLLNVNDIIDFVNSFNNGCP